MPIKLVKTDGSISFKSNGIPMSKYNEQIAAKESEIKAEYEGIIEGLETEIDGLEEEVEELETEIEELTTEINSYKPCEEVDF